MSTKITINGKEKEISANSTVADMLNELEVTGSMFVVEKNLKIVDKEDYSATQVQDGDVIELVGFFGGG
ncbi:MAG: sulfur carrier protein ThiS [Candidatus Gastranaerophilales bacterium]|nr:sulfur carrier protein ThiS [Candidatus Gastranaerophilales bacterium]